jgi:hypothetical protein
MAKRRVAGADIILIGKIDQRLGACRKLKQACLPTLDFAAQTTLRLDERRHTLALGLGSKKIGKSLHLRQIKSPVLKGAPRKGASLGWLKIGKFGKGALDRRNDGASAVEVQFDHVFPGDCIWPRQP